MDKARKNIKELKILAFHYIIVEAKRINIRQEPDS